MATLTFTIYNGNIDRIITALEGLYPIPMINVGTETEMDMQPEFTPEQWAKECTRRWIVTQVARYEQKIAKEAILYKEENNLIT